jgi:hypothetical protein
MARYLSLSSMLFCALISTGCQNDQILKIRSLSEPIQVSESADNNGDIVGVERASSGPDGKIHANILVVHGMGWEQQDKNGEEIGFDLIEAVETAYGVSGSLKKPLHLCPQTDPNARRSTRFPEGGLIISTRLSSFQTDSPLTRVASKEVACLDKIEIDLGSKGSVVVYRLFWDDDFYNSYEYPHLGFDDNVYNYPEATTYEQDHVTLKHLGYEHIDDLRASINSRIKMELVTYGFSDAALYIGPVGELIRDAIRGGICAAITEAAGDTGYLARLPGPNPDHDSAAQFTHKTSDELCDISSGNNKIPFTIVAKSLGSRVVFDVLTRDRTPALAEKLSRVSNNELEVFMFANQVPLIGLGRLDAKTRPTPPTTDTQIKFVPVSEINDLLTFELVPYFEHLYYLRCNGRYREEVSQDVADCKVSDFYQRMDNLRLNRETRKLLVKELGFNVIDVRAKFASNYVPLIPFVNPTVAHTGHISSIPIRDLFICGADHGKARTKADGCTVQ